MKTKCAKCEDTGEKVNGSEHPSADDTCYSCDAYKKRKKSKKSKLIEKVWVFPESYPKTRFIGESWDSFPWKDRLSREDHDIFVNYFLEQFMNRYPQKEVL